MSPEVLAYASQAMYLVLVLSLPPILVASVVGICLSLFQAVTQLQEQTLTFGVKLIAVAATLFLTSSWILAELLRFAQEIFERFHLL
ncbi:MAG: type III secretion system export apparatus subunit SctS [Deltaproteobacteria bacterium]|jgi:type III secretion protein S|nr:type III secretion system export apparatus subunit SctS [Deltaproteobacteria bacterium]